MFISFSQNNDKAILELHQFKGQSQKGFYSFEDYLQTEWFWVLQFPREITLLHPCVYFSIVTLQ